MNVYIKTGLLLIAVNLLINQFMHLPEMIYGFSNGLGISLLLIAAFSTDINIRKRMSKKKEFLKKLISKK